MLSSRWSEKLTGCFNMFKNADVEVKVVSLMDFWYDFAVFVSPEKLAPNKPRLMSPLTMAVGNAERVWHLPRNGSVPMMLR